MEEISPTLYADIRKVAMARLRGDRAAWSIGATDLAHDVLARLLESGSAEGVSRSDLLKWVAQMCRNMLVDRARRRARSKHGGEKEIEPLHSDPVGKDASAPIEVLAIDDALAQLANLDTRQAKIIELRYFGGLTIAETAEGLGVSTSTIDKEERKARAWLEYTLRADD